MFAKKICPKNEKLYIFEKPMTMPFQICKILNNLIFNQEKLKMCKFPLTSCLQIICKIFFANLTTESQRILKTNTESNRQANFYIDAKKT